MENKITHTFLVEQGAKWLNKKAPNTRLQSQFVVTEFAAQGTNENPDIFGLRPYGTVMIEVKTSRRDYHKDNQKRGRNPQRLQLGNFRYYLAPKGLIDPLEIRQGWGLLWWDGEKIVEVKEATYQDADDRAVMFIYHSILRRLHKSQVFNFREKSDPLLNSIRK